MLFFFLLECSATTSKLNVLVNKLHEYLAHSTVEDSNCTPTSQDADGTAFDYCNHEKNALHVYMLEEHFKLIVSSQV